MPCSSYTTHPYSVWLRVLATLGPVSFDQTAATSNIRIPHPSGVLVYPIVCHVTSLGLQDLWDTADRSGFYLNWVIVSGGIKLRFFNVYLIRYCQR